MSWFRRHKDTAESSAAAREDNAPRAETQKRAVMQAIADAPSNDWEVHLATGVPYTSIQGCRGRLRDEGLIANSGMKSATGTGSKGIVWTPTALGLHWLATT